MDGCPRRGDPSFPGWIITLWLKFAFNCTGLSVIPCCVDKSPPGSFAHSLCCHCPQTTVPLVPTTHPFLSICIPAAYPALAGWWRCVCNPLRISVGPKALPTGSFLLDGHNGWILIWGELYALSSYLLGWSCIPLASGLFPSLQFFCSYTHSFLHLFIHSISKFKTPCSKRGLMLRTRNTATN